MVEGIEVLPCLRNVLTEPSDSGPLPGPLPKLVAAAAVNGLTVVP